MLAVWMASHTWPLVLPPPACSQFPCLMPTVLSPLAAGRPTSRDVHVAPVHLVASQSHVQCCTLAKKLQGAVSASCKREKPIMRRFCGATNPVPSPWTAPVSNPRRKKKQPRRKKKARHDRALVSACRVTLLLDTIGKHQGTSQGQTYACDDFFLS